MCMTGLFSPRPLADRFAVLDLIDLSCGVGAETCMVAITHGLFCGLYVAFELTEPERDKVKGSS